MKRPKYDVFISHASEDKDRFVRSFARCLLSLGLSVWYDELQIIPGDSLRRSIDEGLACSDRVVVVLSKQFFRKKWPDDELAGVFSRETKKKRIIIPIWLDVTRAQVTRFSPILADRVAITSGDPEGAAREVFRTIRKNAPQSIVSEASLDLRSTAEFTLMGKGTGDELSHSISGRIRSLLPASLDFMMQAIEGRLAARELGTEVARELIVNAFAHQDYTLARKVSVRIGTALLIVSSPGFLPRPLTLSTLKNQHVAIARNPRLAYELYKLGYMELLGMGLRALQGRLLERGYPLPRFREIDRQFVVEVDFQSENGGRP